MFEVRQTRIFQRWLDGLRDRRAQQRIATRLLRLEAGLFGDSRSVGAEVSELKVDVGPGYRVYFTRKGRVLVVLLCGGDKSTQARDIALAHGLAADLDLSDRDLSDLEQRDGN